MYEICVNFVFRICMFYNMNLNIAFVVFRYSGELLRKKKLTARQIAVITPKTAKLFSEVKCAVRENKSVPSSTKIKVTRLR